jgi:hypothetical protein
MAMITGQDAFLIALGILACFSGYSMFRSMLPLWGFILGGWFAYIMLPAVVGPGRADSLIVKIVGIGIGALIGAAISTPLYYVIVFLSGAALGMIFGVMFGTLIDVGGLSSMAQLNQFIALSFPPAPQSGMQFLMMVIGGLILGSAALNFQKFMICASSAFLGAAAIITGLGGSLGSLTSSDMNRSAFMLIGFLILGMIGLFVQFRAMGET